MEKLEEVEDGNSSLLQPFVRSAEITQQQHDEGDEKKDGRLGMVLFSTAIAVCGSFEYGLCLGYSSPTQIDIMDELGLSTSQYSVFGSILNIGAMIGAITCGKIADYFGRKGAMRMSSIICIAGWIAILLAQGPLALNVGRFFTGYGIGVFSYVVPVFISEITPKNLRGALASANQIFIVFGILVVYLIGAFVKWRILAVTGTIPCLVIVLGLFFIPESPRWLAMVGRDQEFEDSLQKLRGPEADISQEEAEIKDSLDLIRQLPKATILDLFRRNNIKFVIVGVGLMVFQQFGGINGIIFYADEIFVSAGVSGSLGSILYSSLQVLLTACLASFIDKAGRRPFLLVSSCGLLVSNLMIGSSFLLKELNLASSFVPVLAIIGVMLYIAFFSLGMGAIPWVLMSEVLEIGKAMAFFATALYITKWCITMVTTLKATKTMMQLSKYVVLFPLHLKGIAGSMVTLVNWFGSWFISFSFSFLMSWSSYGTFFVYACVCVFSVLFIVKLVPETKGRTLEEIQAHVD